MHKVAKPFSETIAGSLLQRWWPLVLFLAAWWWLFWPMMSGQTVVGFRDSAYLYYPLFQWIDDQWAAGEIPLWNPYCNFGMSVVGDGTSSVFYPGKLIFLCRFLSFPARYGIYLAIHIPLAAAGTYWFARTLKANPVGAALAAFSFAFGGSVLFQVTNVVYLVSAAWLPFALCCVWKMIKTGDFKWAIGAGACCAMMILGGDPQMVYHVGLIAAATMLGEFFRRRSRRIRNLDRSQVGAYCWLSQSALRLAVMIAATTMLALIQLLPTYEWSKLSERTNPESAVNVYGAFRCLVGWENSEINREAQEFARANSGFIRRLGRVLPAVPQKSTFDEQLGNVYFSLLGPPQAGTPTDHAYQFSQPPWSVAELFWPNASGKMFPIYRRWTDVLPGADRIWVPSIYTGLLTVLIAIGGFRLAGRRRRQGWLTRVCLFFAIASFGWYGGVWLINEWLSANHQTRGIGPQIGGIYWAMTMLLPKYFAFRYPAKLFVIASLCLSLLAGLQLHSFRLHFPKIVVFPFCMATFVGLFVLLFKLDTPFFHLNHSDVMFGPFDKEGFRSDSMFGLSQTLIVLGLAALFLKQPFSRKKSCELALIAVLAITIFDLAIANRWMLAEVPSSAFAGTSPLLGKLRDEISARPRESGPLSIYRSREQNFEPMSWSTTQSENRLSEIVLWQRKTLFPKHHFEQRVRLVGSFCSIWPIAYEEYLLDTENVRITVAKMKAANPTSSVTLPNPIEPQCDAEFSFLQSAKGSQIEFDWLPSRSRLVFLADSFDKSPAQSRLSAKRFGTDFQSQLNRNNKIKRVTSNETNCRIVSFSINSIDLRVKTEQQRWLIHNSLYDGNWMATIKEISSGEERKERLVNVDKYNQGIQVGPGDFEITFYYQPTGFWVGASICGLSWLLLLMNRGVWLKKIFSSKRKNTFVVL